MNPSAHLPVPGLLTKREAAQQVRISIRNFEQRIKAGDFPVTRIGRRVLVRQDVLTDWIERHTSPATHFESTLAHVD